MSPTAVFHLSARLLARRTARAALARFLPLLVLVWMAPSVAHAGQYDVYQCKAPGGHNREAEVTFGWNVSYISADSNCGGDANGRVVLSLGTDARASSSYVRGDIIVPNPITISSLSIERTATLTPGSSGDSAASPYLDVWAGDSPWTTNWQHLDRCAYFGGCFNLGLGDPGVTWAPTGSGVVRFEVGCGGQPGGGCSGGPAPRVAMAISSIHMVLREDVPPKVGDLPTGSILSSEGVHRGSENAKFTAYDSGSGVYRATATLDGVVVGSVGPPCAIADVPGDSDFYKIVPCPWSAQLDVPVDTRAVADGQHRFELTVADAAGNGNVVLSRNVVIDNVPPPKAISPPVVSGDTFPTALRPGDKLTAQNGTWSGGGLTFAYRWQRYDAANGWVDIPGATSSSYVVAKADVDRKLRVVVTAKNADGEVESAAAASDLVKSGATVTVASLAPSSAAPSEPSSPQLVLDREQRSVQVRYGAKIVVTGRLVDADAAPIADADVDVFEQVSVVGAPWRKVATIKTDSQGGYVYRPATTGGRVLRFAYAAKRDSGDYRATREVVIAVTAGMEIKAVHRSIPAQGVIRLRGRVLAEPLPAAGTWVEVQVLDAGVWRTVGTRRTSATGQWSFKHRVRRTSNVTFAFRARLRQMSDVPAIESKSAPVKVHVR